MARTRCRSGSAGHLRWSLSGKVAEPHRRRAHHLVQAGADKGAEGAHRLGAAHAQAKMLMFYQITQNVLRARGETRPDAVEVGQKPLDAEVQLLSLASNPTTYTITAVNATATSDNTNQTITAVPAEGELEKVGSSVTVLLQFGNVPQNFIGQIERQFVVRNSFFDDDTQETVAQTQTIDVVIQVRGPAAAAAAAEVLN